MARSTSVPVLTALILSAIPAASQVTAVSPPSATVAGPYSPGVLTKDFLYVAGQIGATAQESLGKIETIVKTAGLKMENVVYVHFYVADMTKLPEAEAAWKSAFPKNAPARAIIGIAKLPQNSPFEINAVAVRDLTTKRAITLPGDNSTFPAGMIAADKLFLSSSAAATTDAALDHMGKTLAAAGLGFQHMVFINPYVTDATPMGDMNKAYAARFEFGNTPARATIRVMSLPDNASIAFTGVAIRDLAKRQAFRPKNMAPSPTASPCVLAGDTFYCSAKSGFIPGPQSGIYASTVEHQLRQTMRNLLDGLEEAGMSWNNVVATVVYLDDLAEFPKMNPIYGEYLGTPKPARTTLQQIKENTNRAGDARGRWPKLEEISLIAVK